MAGRTFQLAIDAVYKGSGAFKKAKSDLDGLERDAKKSSDGLKSALKGIGIGAGAVVGALGAIAVGAKMAWDTLQQGAALEAARGRFDNLAVSINTTGDALLGKMREATQGMMSDAALIASASDMISLGLAKTEEEAIRLTNVVGQLGWDMQVLTLTMANNSVARLDSLGLSMEDVKRRAQELADAGMAMDEAFDLAVIEAGEAKIELLGSAADTTAGKIAMLQTAVENAKNAFAETFASELAGDMGEVGDSAQALGESMEYAAVGAGKMSAALVGGPLKSFAAVGQSNELFDLARELEKMGGNLDEIKRKFPAAFSQGRQNAEAVAGAIEAINTQIDDLSDAPIFARSEWDDWAKDVAAAAAEADAALAEVGGGDTAQGYTNRQAARVEALTDKYREETAAVNEILWAGAAEAEGAQQAISDAAQREAEEYARVWKAAVEDMADSFTTAIEGLQDAKVPDIISTDSIINADMLADAVYNAGQSAGASAVELGELGVAIGAFTPEMAEAATKAVIFDTAMQGLAAGWQLGELDTSEFIGQVDALVTELETKTVAEIQLDLKRAENPAREIEAWIPAEERTQSIEVELTPMQEALNTAIETATAGEEKVISFVPETGDVDRVIGEINGRHISVFVDFIPTGPVPGATGAVGGTGTGAVGGTGPGRSGDRSGTYSANVVVNVNGSADGRSVGRSVKSAMDEFYAGIQRAGVRW